MLLNTSSRFPEDSPRSGAGIVALVEDQFPVSQEVFYSGAGLMRFSTVASSLMAIEAPSDPKPLGHCDLLLQILLRHRLFFKPSFTVWAANRRTRSSRAF